MRHIIPPAFLTFTMLLLLQTSAWATGPRVTTALFTPDAHAIHAHDFPPYLSNEVVDGGPISAITTEAFRRSNLQASIQVEPLRGIVRYYLTQEHAFAIIEHHMQFSEAEKKQLIFIPLMTITEHYFYYKPHHPDGFNWPNDIHELKGRTLGYHASDAPPLWQKAGIRIQYGRTIDMMKQLKNGDVDFIKASKPSIQWLSAHYMPDDQANFVTMGDHHDDEVIQIVFNRNHPQGASAAAAFQKALDAMHNDGTYQRLLQQHTRSTTEVRHDLAHVAP